MAEGFGFIFNLLYAVSACLGYTLELDVCGSPHYKILTKIDKIDEAKLPHPSVHPCRKYPYRD